MEKNFSFKQIMPQSVIKQLPSVIYMPIKNSEFFLIGQVNYIKMTIEGASLTTHAKRGRTFSHISNKWKKLIPRDITFTVVADGQETPWKSMIFGLNPDTFEIENYICSRGGIFDIIMAEATDEQDVDHEIRISTGLGYAFPARFDTGSTLRKIQGRVPRVLEELGNGNYSGEIFFEVQFVEGRWHAWMQGETKVDAQDQPVKTARMVRRSIKSNEELALTVKRGLFHQSTGRMCLDPSYICAGSVNLGWIETHAIELLEDQRPEEGKQWTILLSNFFRSADGAGLAAAFPWILWRVVKYASALTPNNTPANVPVDRLVNIGPNITIGVVRMKDGSIRVISRGGQTHNREGKVIPCIMESGFDPSSISATPITHTLGAIDPNTKRKASTATEAGLHPVIVHEYQEHEIPNELTLETLDDVKQNGDGPAWMALAMYLWHLYGAQVENLNIGALARLLPETKN